MIGVIRLQVCVRVSNGLHAELIGRALVPAAGAKRHRQVENLNTSHTSYGVF